LKVLSVASVNLEKYLAALPDGPLYFQPNGGNAGDSMIAHATFLLLKERKIKYHLCGDSAFDPVGKIIIQGGGGSLVPYYRHSRDFIREVHSRAKKLIIFPHTVHGHEDLLKELGENVDIFCREEISYAHVRKHSKANVMLSDDLAFRVNPREILAEKPTTFMKNLVRKLYYLLSGDRRRMSIPSCRTMLRNDALELHQRTRSLFGRGRRTLYAFRKDREKTHLPVPPGNLDISRMFAYGTQSEQVASYATYRMMRFLSLFDEIRTNRLHVGIGGALLGKSVKLHPNRDYKCEAVYRYSMEKKFPHVQWVD